jgi:hypothetical protein
VNVLNDKDEIIVRHSYKKCKFLRASNINHSYDTEESVKIQMIFSSEMQELWFNQGESVE